MINWIELHNINHQTILEPSEEGSDKTLLQVIQGTKIKKWRLSTDGDDRGSVEPEAVLEYFPNWPFRDMSADEIHQFREILSTIPDRIRIRIADLPKGIFFVNSDMIVEEDFFRLYDDFDRLRAWTD